MKYIEKTISSPSGHDNTCWPPLCGNFDLIQNQLSLIVPGYKDVDAKTAGSYPMETRSVNIPFTSLPSWEALWAEALNYMVTTDGDFKDGTIEDLPE